MECRKSFGDCLNHFNKSSERTNFTMEDEHAANTDDSGIVEMITNASLGVLVLCFYIIGVYLHSKVIVASKRDKEMTWKLDVINSVGISFHYAHVLILSGITYLIKDLYIYTGSWFCYLSKIITLSGMAHVTGHSLIIALMKYTMIVHQNRVTAFGKDKVKKIFIGINIMYPIYIQCSYHIFRPDFLFVYDGISQANRCLGNSEFNASNDGDKTAIKLVDLCDFEAPSNRISVEFGFHAFRKGVCWFHVLVNYFNFFNIIEAFIYCVVFNFMRRLVQNLLK